ncbi:hypothetical protein [Brevundimonas sp.]|uniref:hypothetical protein n=1 Tax=Brevundimonas sp. TaxID=1871086 RepID=UPI002737A646|nr:hypothetical protein [Brevundimonas sp.]MDP3800756.1 hypothetical protein [Brevundimonas sp.]
MRRSICLIACLAILASCERSPEPAEAPAATAFSYASTGDLSGYYMPASDVRVGKWSLDHVFVGQAAEFRLWTGDDSSATFAPVMLQFDDVTSPMVQTELGEARSVTARVLPTRYAVSDDRLRFEGTSPELGRVSFEGRLDPGALATSRRNLGDEGVVLTGTLTAGGQTVRDVRLRWWMGD